MFWNKQELEFIENNSSLIENDLDKNFSKVIDKARFVNLGFMSKLAFFIAFTAYGLDGFDFTLTEPKSYTGAFYRECELSLSEKINLRRDLGVSTFIKECLIRADYTPEGIVELLVFKITNNPYKIWPDEVKDFLTKVFKSLVDSKIREVK